MSNLSINTTTDFGEVLNTCKDYEELQQTLEPIGIHVTQTDDARVQFQVNQFDTSIPKYKIRYQCKGVILDELEHNVLSIPGLTHSYYDNIEKKLFSKIYEDKKYKVIKAKDGTNVTLYNFNGLTCMATGKSCDVSNYYWEGSQTFSQMFYESAQTNPVFISQTNLQVTTSGNLSWNIPENYCITFGFRHHNIHQNINDQNDIWLVRCVDRHTGLDCQPPDGLNTLKTNESLTELDITLQDIIDKCNRDQSVDQEENFYGYILICQDPEVRFDLQRVFMPSTLYKTLQHFFYSFHKNKNDSLTHNNRYLYSIFLNILTNNTNYLKLLCELNPNYTDKIQQYNVFINNIATKTYTRLQDSEYGNDDEAVEFMDNLIQRLKQDETDIDVNSEVAAKLINDYVRYYQNAKVLVDLYIKKMQ